MSNGPLLTSKSRPSILRNLHAQYWLLLVVVVAVAACERDAGPPTPGRATVEFVGMSDSDVTLTLGNGFDRAIYIRGSRTLSRAIQVWRSETEITCETAAGQWESALFGSTEGIEPRFVELLPQTRTRLVIPTTFPQQHKGRRCHLTLILRDGMIVGPTEFRAS
ncbi:MAG TPA: hypothetical protein VJQ52_20000 [Steroidobacteraceae bacterium]|nr:hypothetical protein [Steroidobacteraceae bacterium]